jgi:hypothetical protein
MVDTLVLSVLDRVRATVRGEIRKMAMPVNYAGKDEPFCID